LYKTEIGGENRFYF